MATRDCWRLLLGTAAACLVACNAFAPTLPSRYDLTLFTPEHGFPEPPERLGDGPGGRILIAVPVEGVMAFTTPSNYLGLYDASGALEDEVRLGAFAVELVSWNSDAIALRVDIPGPAGPSHHEREYVRSVAARATRFGSVQASRPCGMTSVSGATR